MNGYDIGGAEYPYDAKNYSVIDLQDPHDIATEDQTNEEIDVSMIDWIECDLELPDWYGGLEPRPEIYIDKCLRYIERSPRVIANEVYGIWARKSARTRPGTLVVFDTEKVVRKVMFELLLRTDVVLETLELVNPAFEGSPAEWRLVLKKG